jgi:hypothetical protein
MTFTVSDSGSDAGDQPASRADPSTKPITILVCMFCPDLICRVVRDVFNYDPTLRIRTAGEYEKLLDAAGLKLSRIVSTTSPVSVVETGP